MRPGALSGVTIGCHGKGPQTTPGRVFLKAFPRKTNAHLRASLQAALGLSQELHWAILRAALDTFQEPPSDALESLLVPSINML